MSPVCTQKLYSGLPYVTPFSRSHHEGMTPISRQWIMKITVYKFIVGIQKLLKRNWYSRQLAITAAYQPSVPPTVTGRYEAHSKSTSTRPLSLAGRVLCSLINRLKSYCSCTPWSVGRHQANTYLTVYVLHLPPALNYKCKISTIKCEVAWEKLTKVD